MTKPPTKMIRPTHTFVTLELSPAAFEEIKLKLKQADYEHCFVEQNLIDMHGIAVAPQKPDPQTVRLAPDKPRHTFKPNKTDGRCEICGWAWSMH